MSELPIEGKKQINRVALGTGLLNLVLSMLLLCGQLFENSENAVHRMAGSGSTLFISWFLGIIIGGSAILHTVLALALKRKPGPRSNGAKVRDTFLVLFSAGYLWLAFSLTLSLTL